MKLNEFEEMLDSAVGCLDACSTAKSIRALGYNLHFYNETTGHDNTDDQPVKWKGLVGLEDTKIYLTVFDGTVNPNITRADLLRLYKPFLKELHKIAINTRYGLNCYVHEAVSDAIMDTARLACIPYNDVLNAYRRMGLITSNSAGEPVKNYIMEDTDMIYALTTKMTSRGGARWLAALEPKKIHFNGPATIVEWNDGTKTVVKCQRGDTFDPLTGVAMCCMKKMLGTNESHSNYLNGVSKLIDEALEAKNKRYKKKEEALRYKKEIAEPDWSAIAEELDKRFDKAVDMLFKSTDDMLNNLNQEDKHD